MNSHMKKRVMDNKPTTLLEYGHNISDGSTAHYYELPEGARELQDIISYLDCNAQLGEIGRAWMRYGKCSHSPKMRDIKKIIFYANEELKRLERYEEDT